MLAMLLYDPTAALRKRSIVGVSSSRDWGIMEGKVRRGSTGIEMRGEILGRRGVHGTQTTPQRGGRWEETHIKRSKHNTRIICHNTPTKRIILTTRKARINTDLSHQWIVTAHQIINATNQKQQATTPPQPEALTVTRKPISAAIMLHETQSTVSSWIPRF